MTKTPLTPSVLVVTLSLDRGGTETHLAQIMPRLSAKGWPISIFGINGRGELADAVERAGVKVMSPQSPSKLAAALSLLSHMRQAKPAIVHFFLPAPYLIGAPIAIATRRPVTIMSRRSLNDYQAKRPALAKVERRLHNRMSAVIANSGAIARQLIVEEGVEHQRAGLIYNGVEIPSLANAAERSAVRSELSIAEDALVFVLAANLIGYKGHADLLHALAIAQSNLPPRWQLICAGRDEGLQSALMQQAREDGISDHILFLGARTDVPRLLAAGDIGLNCSHEEGFSNAVLEGMAAGLPMVVTGVGGNPEAVRDGVDGLVAPPRNPKALAAALLRLACDREVSRAFGHSGRERARSEFSVSACVDRYDRLYRGLLDGQQAAGLVPVAAAPSPAQSRSER